MAIARSLTIPKYGGLPGWNTMEPEFPNFSAAFRQLDSFGLSSSESQVLRTIVVSLVSALNEVKGQ